MVLSGDLRPVSFNLNILGPVVQSVVSLTSSLRVISLTVLADSIYNILKFFAEKMWVAFAKDSKYDHHEGFQSKQGSEIYFKKSIYTCKVFLSICLSDLVPLEHPFCSPVFAGINLNIMHTAILRSGSFPHR